MQWRSARSGWAEEIKYRSDKRTLFFGKQLDHIFVRGLTTTGSAAFAVSSSDHNRGCGKLKVTAPASVRELASTASTA